MLFTSLKNVTLKQPGKLLSRVKFYLILAMPVPSLGQKFRKINYLEIGKNSAGMGTFALL